MKKTAAQKKRSREIGFIYNFLRRPLAMAGLVMLIIEIALIFLLPVILDIDAYYMDTANVNAPPSDEYILGTDALGRDCLARLCEGGKTSIIVGVVAVSISIAIGVPLGMVAGYYRGVSEMIIMRLSDIFMSLPTMILVLVLVAVFNPSLSVIIIVIGVVGWTGVGKLVYAATLSVRNKEFIDAAKAIGTSDAVILFKEVLPNVMTPIWMTLAFRISAAILTESSLSFLGAGVQPPQPSWGNIISAAQQFVVLATRPWQWIPAGLCLFMTVVAFNLIGEGIRDVMDPRTRKR